jgi:hypothetical protein
VEVFRKGVMSRPAGPWGSKPRGILVRLRMARYF